MQISELADQVNEKARGTLGASVLDYLAENPWVFDDAKGFAVWLGVTVAELRPVLDILCDKGILQRAGTDDNVIYSLTSPVLDERLIEPLIASLQTVKAR